MDLYRENAKLLQLWKFPFISWIKLFYTDISSSIQNNGWTSGFPLSPYFFILCAENLRASIRQDKQIRGMNSENECKVSQHADDTTLILDGTKSSIERSFFFLLDRFGKLSDLNLNYEKTEALWIGSFSNS